MAITHSSVGRSIRRASIYDVRSRCARTLLAGLLFVFSAANVHGHSGHAGRQPMPPAMAMQLQSALDDLKRYGVLGAVLAVEGGVLERRAFVTGHADLERSQPMSADLQFMAASQTKMLTAAAVLLLEKEGRLSLDDPPARYVEGAPGDGVTLRHLLLHTSGIGDGVELFAPPVPWQRTTFSLSDLLLLGRIVGPAFEPGARYAYNNTGYVILGAVVERVAGMTRERFVRERILGPLGMTHTWFGTGERWPRERMARGYIWERKYERVQDTSNPPDLSWAGAAGDMVTTAGDMLTWLSALREPNNPLGLTLDDFTAVTVETGERSTDVRYGYGLSGQMAGGLLVWGHGGSIPGYLSVSSLHPATGVAVSLLLSLDGAPDASLSKTVSAMLDVLTTAVTLGVSLDRLQ